MLPALAISVALSAAAVPPGAPVENHAHPGHYAQPTLQVFARQPVDQYRQANWLRYNAELDQLWLAYRTAGSTPAAWQTYQAAANEAKFHYLYHDPYLLPVVRPNLAYLPPWEQVIHDGSLTAGATCCP